LEIVVAALVPSTTAAVDASAGSIFEDSVAVYGPWLFPTVKALARCGEYRVLVAYVAGTDMLFLDRLQLTQDNSMFEATDGLSFSEFNAYEASNDIGRVSCRLRGPETLEISGTAESGHLATDSKFSFRISVNLKSKSYSYHDNLRK
jgi:hypothetical protein